jgi:hypothetical protein
MATQAFVDMLPGHLEGDAGSQARLPVVVERLKKIADLRAPKGHGAPTKVRARIAGPIPVPAPAALPGVPSSVPPGWVAFGPTNIRAARYDSATLELTIEFHSGGIYVYAGVPPTIFQGLRG